MRIQSPESKVRARREPLGGEGPLGSLLRKGFTSAGVLLCHWALLPTLTPGLYVLESSCPSLGTTAFSVFPLIQLQQTGPFKQGSRRWSRWRRKHCTCEHWNRLTFKGWAHSSPSPKTWHKLGQPACVVESQLLAYLPRTYSPIKIVAPKTRSLSLSYLRLSLQIPGSNLRLPPLMTDPQPPLLFLQWALHP